MNNNNNFQIGDWVCFDENSLKNDSLFPNDITHRNRRRSFACDIVGLTSYAVFLVKEINGNLVAVESMSNNKLYTVEITRLSTFFRVYWPCDMHSTRIDVGDKCVFADSDKRLIIGTVIKFGKFRGQDIVVTFGNLIGVKEQMHTKTAKLRSQIDSNGRLLLEKA